MRRGDGLVVPRSGSAVAEAQAVRVVPGLAGVTVRLQSPNAARAASRRLVSAGVFSHGCSDKALIMAAISQRARQLPRHAIISSADIAAAAREASTRVSQARPPTACICSIEVAFGFVGNADMFLASDVEYASMSRQTSCQDPEGP